MGPDARVAVVLNANARSVTERSVDMVRDAVGKNEKLFVTSSFEEAERVSEEILKNRFDVVLSGGGDGTFCHIVTAVSGKELLDRRRRRHFGILRMGTGNALADTLGARFLKTSDDVRQEFWNARQASARRVITLLRCDGKIAPFLGAGLDAMVLEDYGKVRRELDESPIDKRHRGKLEYGLAIATKTLWRLMFGGMPEARIVNTSPRTAGAVQVDHRGGVTGQFGEGETIYEGPAAMVAASTIKNYGMGLRMFPYIDPQDRAFQLRVVGMRAYQMLAHAPALLLGDMVHHKMKDFFCEKVAVEFDRPVPFQIGGDLEDRRKSFEFETVPVDVVLGSGSLER